MSQKIQKFLIANVVPITFGIVSIIGIYFSGTSLPLIIRDVVFRIDRNGFLILSLLIPVITGLGLNFAIVLGAMAGQLGLIIVTIFNLSGFTAIILASLIAIPFAVFFGILTGKLFNKSKGKEMITGLILGFFASGVYQFIVLYVIGGIIPVNNPALTLSEGVGIRASIDLPNVKSVIDNAWSANIFIAISVFLLIPILRSLYYYFVKKNKQRKYLIYLGVSVLGIALCLGLQNLSALSQYKTLIKVPMLSYLLILGLCLAIPLFFKTKLGQDMRAVGQDMHIASVSGINVNKTRIIAICISTVIASFGQIMFIQNLGNLSTYNAHENVGMFSAAALLIGGATVAKATVPQAMLGALLFHILFNVSPTAGRNIFGAADIGEYFRVFIAYGIIAITLALHSWKKIKQEAAINLRQE